MLVPADEDANTAIINVIFIVIVLGVNGPLARYIAKEMQPLNSCLYGILTVVLSRVTDFVKHVTYCCTCCYVAL